MAKTIAVETPLAEITFRKYESPSNLENRELVRKVCLSLGLLQPGDSRDVVVDVFQALLENKKELTSKEIENLTIANRKRYKLPMLGIAPSNVRRQLLRLRDLFLVEKVKNNYRIRENTVLENIFVENIEKYYLASIITRVKEYIKEADKKFLQ